jgi:hypothetical protein
MSPGEIFQLRMELSAAGIGWWAAYPLDGQLERFRSISEAGIKLLISDYPRASLTVIENPAGGLTVWSAPGTFCGALRRHPSSMLQPSPKRQQHRRRV